MSNYKIYDKNGKLTGYISEDKSGDYIDFDGPDIVETGWNRGLLISWGWFCFIFLSPQLHHIF